MENTPLDPARFSEAMVEVVEGLRWEKRFKSARALALSAGMTHTYLGARLNGTTPFNVGDVAALANAFGVTPNAIFDSAISLAMSDPAAELDAVADESDIEGAGENSI